jgi:hypothetical protein
LKVRDHLKDLDTDGGIMLKEIEWECMDWILLAVDTEKGQALMNVAMTLWVPQNAGSFVSECGTGSF